MRTWYFLFLLCGILSLLGCTTSRYPTGSGQKDHPLSQDSDRIGDTTIDVDSDRTGQSLADYLRRVPGVQVRGDQVYVRNAASIVSSDQPLFVVDGNPVGDDFGDLAAFLNPNDIDYIEVLKDATSLSEYGSRGANGVIRIYTKKE